MSGGNIAVHVERVARRLMRMQEGAAATEQHRTTVTHHRLSRVPAHLRDGNPDAYTPRFVAIGPLHHDDRRLRSADRIKMAYLNSLISRGHPDPAHHLAVIQEYVRLVAAREPEARAFYNEEDLVEIDADNFVGMMVLDGCFIVEHLVNVFIGREEPLLHATPFGPAHLYVDLILAENQIPFFVLVDLINKTRLPELESTSNDPPVLLMKLALSYLAGEKGCDLSEALPSAEGVSHILHLLHAMITTARTKWEPLPSMQDAAVLETAEEVAWLLCRLPLLLLVPLLYPILPEKRKWRARYGQGGVPSASDLKKVCVRFRKARGEGKVVAGIASVMGPVPLAVKLAHEDRLRLPQLRIEFRTVPLLLNLMAFEQSTEVAKDVSAFVSFMAKMVQSAEDAGVLIEAEVVQSTGNENKDDVARFFRKMGAASEAAGDLEESYLGAILEELRKGSRHPLFVMLSDVQHNYFSEPWAVVAAFFAFVTFVCTVLQTYTAFKHK